ncbi:polyadenylate-binding protein-interacting protein 1 isoform X2 [Thrips palmi]|uniref:Polyadenylate-binding protein-interacting protein 1 isoform X2 n=1 Tax=Thrips palmi TaxID=161013 RepID=A0A6P8YVD9_THRPL|nr:polyadenylate-binding protein-interacting protein 1 isoform X2 [Thrips palmi]
MNPPNGQVKAVGRGRGAFREQTTELRRPQGTLSPPSEPSSSDNDTSKDEVSDVLAVAMKSNLSVHAKEFRSNLSVDAKEFVPKFGASSAPSYSQNYEETNAFYDDYGQAEEEGSDVSPEEWAILQLNEVIKMLTCDPGKFDQLAKPLVDDLTPMLAVEEIVENAATLIIDQAITEPNFRYSGARLCKLLSKVRVKKTISHSFRSILLNKLGEEHDRIESNLVRKPDQVYGFIQFLAELYIQLELETNQRISILGDSLLMALKILIQVPNVDNIKNACNILKLTGRMLEADQSDMNSFFSDLQKLLDDENTPTRAKNMLSHILKLRKEMWGHAVSVESIPSALAESEQASDGVYYGPDHRALTAEEITFLNESCGREETVSVGDDSTVWDPHVNEDENAEIMAAFNEFVNQKPRH